MDDIKVSVCMITYNHERYIAQAVESVLAQQTKCPFEIVIGEDCSTDKTRRILLGLARRYPQTIRLRLADDNQGVNRNLAGTIGAARGRYVALLEGDDYWATTEKLQRQVEALDSHADWAVCFHPASCTYEAGFQGDPIFPLDWTKQEATIDDLFENNFIPTCSVMFRNRLFAEFPAWYDGLKLGDWPLHLLNAEHGNIGYLPEVMATYRVHRGGVWSGASQATRITAILEMLTAVDHHFHEKYATTIDRYRLGTMRYVLGELDAVKTRVAGFMGDLRLQCSQESAPKSNIEANLHTLQRYTSSISSDFFKLETKYNKLRDRHRQLKSFHDQWSKSLAYRITRETHRIIKKIERLWRRSSRTEIESQSRMDSPASKAA
ncbi:MAG TPA: glycosyltransferase [Lacipirellulaceae bacterium]|nr:glycosyltransferase [Lacipirellulaceae bacterium]